jgi:hypothetical protein
MAVKTTTVKKAHEHEEPLNRPKVDDNVFLYWPVRVSEQGLGDQGSAWEGRES